MGPGNKVYTLYHGQCPLAVYKTIEIARGHQAFRNQYQIIYPG